MICGSDSKHVSAMPSDKRLFSHVQIGFSPENCRLVSKSDQCLNVCHRNNVIIGCLLSGGFASSDVSTLTMTRRKKQMFLVNCFSYQLRLHLSSTQTSSHYSIVLPAAVKHEFILLMFESSASHSSYSILYLLHMLYHFVAIQVVSVFI